MSTEALALVITGAFLHALWNIFAKKSSGGLHFVWLYGLVSLLVAIPFGLASWQTNAHQLGVQAWLAIAGSALVHIVYSLVLQKGYRESDFSIVYPLARGTGPLFSIAGAIVLLGEVPTLPGWLGIAAVLTGILLVSGIARMSRSDSPHLFAGIIWGCLTGLSIASYTLIDGWAVKALGLAPVLYYFLGLAVRTLMLMPQALRDPQLLRTQWHTNHRYIVAIGILSPLAYTLVLFAMSIAPLSYVAPVREVSMLIGVLMGARLLREALQPSRIMGTVCIVAGVVLLARTH